MLISFGFLDEAGGDQTSSGDEVAIIPFENNANPLGGMSQSV